MKKSLRAYRWLGLGVLLLPLSVAAIRMDCTQGLSSELDAHVTVNIPAFLFFQVGSSNSTATVQFDVRAALPNAGAYDGSEFATSALPPSTISGSDVGDGVNVRVRANCGQVQLAYSVSSAQGLSDGGSRHIPYDYLQTQSSDSGLPAPTLRNSADDEVLVATTAYGSVTDRSATWQYRYNQAEWPVGGEYQGVVTYSATCL